jgi:branched-subunit amino acid transport protein
MPRWAQRGLKYAPIAALTAVIAPEIVMTQGQLISTWQDARLFAVAAGVAWFFWRKGAGQAVLGTILVGAAVYLPLHIGLGW